MDYQCEVSHSLPPALHSTVVVNFISWRGIWCTNAGPYSLPSTSHFAVEHTTRNGDVVDNRGYIDPTRIGNAFDTTGYIDPLVRWEDSGKVLQHYLRFLARFAFEFHLCPYTWGALPPVELSHGHSQMYSAFFFLHCRTSARHCRSTTRMSDERNQISMKAKANKNKHTNPHKATPTKSPTRQRSREICKQGETGETSASLSSPSQVLFRQVVLPHVVHV